MKTKLAIFSEKIIEAGWLAAAVTVPLFFNIYSARTFEPDKITLLRAIVSVMIVAWIISVVEQGVATTDGPSLSLADRFRQWLKIPLFLPTFLLVVVYIVSTIFSLAPRVSLWGSYQRMQGTYSFLSYLVVFALMAGNLRTRDQVDRLVTIIIISSIPVSLYGIVQRYGLDPLPWAGNVTRRVASNMGNAIFVASYLIMIVPLTLTRLVESMTAIITEEEASWGHTILSAIYIFVLAVQILTIAFSGSRGPMLGLLGAGFVMGLLVILILRRLDEDPSSLSLTELATGLIFVVPLALAGGLGGGGGYFVGLGLQKLLVALSYRIDALPFLGAGLGGLLGFLGLYTYMATSEKGWRWLWVSWLAVAILTIGFVLTLNLRGTGLDLYLDPIRELPVLDRISKITITESGTGKVRVLIWDAAMELVAPHQPLGIPGDEVSGPDRFNLLRPIIGYGPESMFNAFAYVYPPDLAHVEKRGSSADRSHNETMDSLVITGVLGFLAFYFLMVSLFYYALRWLGWVPDKSARRRLWILLVLGALLGAVLPYFLDGDGSPFTFVPLGLPFGLVAGVVIHLIWQGLIRQPDEADSEGTEGVVQFSDHPLLLIGLLGAIIGHFLEVHFVFSIAATYIYFWIYAGLMVALARMEHKSSESTPAPASTAEADPPEAETQPRRARRSRGRRRTRRQKTVSAAEPGRSGVRLASPQQGESLESWIGSQGLAMAIILIILIFDFITPQFQFQVGDRDSMSLLWMFVITWLVGLAIALSDVAVRRDNWQGKINWGWIGLIYGITSIGYSFFYYVVHRIIFTRRITVIAPSDVIKAANVITDGFVAFYIFLFLLMLLFALILSWQRARRLPFWRSEVVNLLLYPVLILAMVGVIWFKNIDVVRADIYLKEGERYRGSRQWDQAIALHQKAVSLDSDEDFFYLMLALDYQLMAQDPNIQPERRQLAWQEGERIALEAREINPYNPDNTGNMGRYYFTLGQVFNQERFQDALTYFEKATILAPSNVIYHNLWAQTHYILQDYEKAVERLEISTSIDPRYPPTWLLLGDTYAAMGDVDRALKAHSQALQLGGGGSNGFSDQFIDQRLNFYISAGRLEDIVAAMQQVAQDKPDDPQIQWAIGHAYNLVGQSEQALPYFEQARSLGDTSARTTRALANTYLALNAFDQALPNYQLLLQNNPDDVEAHSALAFIYAQQGRLEEAIHENQQVLQQLPNDYDSLKNLAILYQQAGRWQEALDAARQAQAVAPEADQPSWQQFITDIESQLDTAG